MTNTTSSILFGRYSPFSKVDTEVDPLASGPIAVRTGHLGYYVALACILLATYLVRSSRQKYADVPFYKAPTMKWMFDAEALVRDSYNKFYGKAYRIKATEGVQVLLPPKFVGELKGLPEETLSAVDAVNEAMLSEYTRFDLGPHRELLTTLIRTRLTQNLARLVPQLRGEVEYIMGTEFPECQDWTAVKIQPFGVRIVARLSGRAFVGPCINRNEEWMDISINYAVHVFLAVVKLQFFPTWLRPIAQYLVADLRRIHRAIARARALLQPIMEERLRDMDTPGAEKADDLVQWLLEGLPEENRRDFQAITELQLIMSAASIHTTNNMFTDCIFDLAANQDIQEELRQEAAEILCSDEAWARKDSMVRLKKMDSFIKEVQRLSGNITGFIRKVVRPIDLSDGTRLPAGTKLLAAQAGMSHDDRYYSSPDTFDPLRFYRMRHRSDEDAHRWQFTSIGDTNLNFGAGKHACPGRFFAGNEIKMMLAYFLLNYDMRLKDGEGRPKAMMLMMSKTPNPDAEVLFKRRCVE